MLMCYRLLSPAKVKNLDMEAILLFRFSFMYISWKKNIDFGDSFVPFYVFCHNSY